MKCSDWNLLNGRLFIKQQIQFLQLATNGKCCYRWERGAHIITAKPEEYFSRKIDCFVRKKELNTSKIWWDMNEKEALAFISKKEDENRKKLFEIIFSRLIWWSAEFIILTINTDLLTHKGASIFNCRSSEFLKFSTSVFSAVLRTINS